ncbi:efflux RND transporter periplasmic adaptor subunit [Kiritimatiellota bacterium B12222]|nr:efflux RND transporter periplasmic adaptor subunit [Kiritimatiellota bacterium B12222]
MELLITIAYIFLIRLVFFDYKLIRFNLFWKFVVFGLYIAAAMTEILFLGQLAPYSKTMFVQSYVVQMAPEFGGRVKEVFVGPSEPVKKGDPLFMMDQEFWQSKVDEAKARLAAAETTTAQLDQQVLEARANVARVKASIEETQIQFQQISEAAKQGAASQMRLEDITKSLESQKAHLDAVNAALQTAILAANSKSGDVSTTIAEATAALKAAEYNLTHTIIRAPSDGYVANHQLYPGSFIRLKQPVMSFVNTEKYWLVATVPQRGIQHLRVGDKALVALEMYPGKLFDAEVKSIIWAAGESQGIPSGKLPLVGQMRGSQLFTVRLEMTGETPEMPLHFGASGMAAMITADAADFLVLLRKIEIQSESFLSYLYNPFK